MFKAIGMILLLGIPLAFADGLPVPECSDKEVDLRMVEPGFRCVTSKGAIFERVTHADFGEAWRAPNNVIWSMPQAQADQPTAIQYCEAIGGALPTRRDFEWGLAAGALELLQDRSIWLWTATPHHRYTYCGIMFHGAMEAFTHEHSSAGRSFLCVAQP